jgi:serine/threonine-protein kinase
MAAVFRARDRKHDCLVAIKLLHPELAEAVGSERLLQEVRITARLNHPHILPLLDSGSADGLLYYVMHFVEGESLRQRSATRAPSSIEIRISVC